MEQRIDLDKSPGNSYAQRERSHAITMNRLLLILSYLQICFGHVQADSPDKHGQPGENLILNGDFKNGTDKWNTPWARDSSTVKAILDTAGRQDGAQSLRIEHSGQRDWSLGHSLELNVQPGEIFELAAWIRVMGTGNATLGVVTRDATGKTMNWVHGARTAHDTKGWVLLRSIFIVPPGTSTVWPRLIGNGPATVWCDEFTFARQGTLESLRMQGLPDSITIRNKIIEVTFRTATATFEVKDFRVSRDWKSRMDESPLIVSEAKCDGVTMDLKLIDASSMSEVLARICLDGEAPEIIVSLRSDCEMNAPLAWPVPFTSATGQLLILPVNEGMSYPTDDSSLSPMYYHLYGGHGLCMPWYGATDGGASWMAIVETPDDAAVRIPRLDGLLCLAPEWLPQKGRFGADRIIRYAIFDSGGYVTMAKRYREYAKKTGLFRTLTEKRDAIPAVDLLVGAVNVWCWDKNPPSICREMQSLGIKRILWSNKCSPEELKELNGMGVLSSRYDIYQDTMAPENFPKLSWLHADWTSEAWANDDLMIGEDGEWVRGWEVETKDGKMIPCGTLCDRQALLYAMKRIPAELAISPYRCRFIDTTTASPWRECYHPKHPMTRTESKKYKMDLLRYVSETCGLVCGSETGHDAAVPFVHYFEGMLSIGPYRIPDSGRNIMRIWDEIPETVAKFQTGHAYRLPLWELVYHDCVVSQWYWGDYNNKLPKLWDRRDLWNALYGTAPMFMFDRNTWIANKDRFVKSYQTTAALARATAYSQMLSHEWLTPDHSVQRTRFANGVTVTVNFGDVQWQLPDGRILAPLQYYSFSDK